MAPLKLPPNDLLIEDLINYLCCPAGFKPQPVPPPRYPDPMKGSGSLMKPFPLGTSPPHSDLSAAGNSQRYYNPDKGSPGLMGAFPLGTGPEPPALTAPELTRAPGVMPQIPKLDLGSGTGAVWSKVPNLFSAPKGTPKVPFGSGYLTRRDLGGDAVDFNQQPYMVFQVVFVVVFSFWILFVLGRICAWVRGKAAARRRVLSL